MSLRKNHAGFSAVELVIILVVVGALALVGYTVYNRMNDKTASNEPTASSDQSSASDVKTAPVINSAEDLDTAVETLDQTDPSPSSDSASLDAELSAF